MVSHGQLARTQNHLAQKPLDWIKWGRKTHYNRGQHHSTGWNSWLSKRRKWAQEFTTLVSDVRCSVTCGYKFLLQQQPHPDGLHPSWAGTNASFLQLFSSSRRQQQYDRWHSLVLGQGKPKSCLTRGKSPSSSFDEVSVGNESVKMLRIEELHWRGNF